MVNYLPKRLLQQYIITQILANIRYWAPSSLSICFYFASLLEWNWVYSSIFWSIIFIFLSPSLFSYSMNPLPRGLPICPFFYSTVFFCIDLWDLFIFFKLAFYHRCCKHLVQVWHIFWLCNNFWHVRVLQFM